MEDWGLSKGTSPGYGAIIIPIYTLMLKPLVFKELLVGRMYGSWQLGGRDLKYLK